MYTLKFLPIAVLVACLPSAMADRCAALGSITNNAEASILEKLALVDLKTNKTLWNATNKNGKYHTVCGNHHKVPAKNTGLKEGFEWSASCYSNAIKNCHGSYGNQTNIAGHKIDREEYEWYDIGTDARVVCVVEFDCDKA